MVQKICEELKIVIVALECDQDHTYMFLDALPTLSPVDIMAKIKGVTSRKLREEFLNFRYFQILWIRYYFVSTVDNVSSETIKRYVEQQKQGGEVYFQKNNR